MNSNLTPVPDSRHTWLTPAAAAAQIRISKATLYRLWLRKAGPRYSTFGSQRRIRQDWLDSWALGREAS